MSPLIPTLFLISTLAAAPRPWQSADGQRSVQGEFIKRDVNSVTIRRSDRKPVTIPLDKLHKNDIQWLKHNHPLPGEEIPPPPLIPAKTLLDTLEFGDTREEVYQKLKESKFVELTVSETFIARVGLNGVFRTRYKIAGLDSSLFFDWTDDSRLKEVIFQTAPLPSTSLQKELIPCWKQFIEILTSLHGAPIHASEDLSLKEIADGHMSSTHLWNLDEGSVMIGAARDGDNYQIAVRFTSETIRPIVK
jgi:hypothetical protein